VTLVVITTQYSKQFVFVDVDLARAIDGEPLAGLEQFYLIDIELYIVVGLRDHFFLVVLVPN
jgi:hypothetical protein